MVDDTGSVDETERRRAEPESVGPPRRGMSRMTRNRADREGRTRRLGARIALAVLLLAAVVVAGTKLLHRSTVTVTDYTGAGLRDVVIQVHDGDSTTVIGQTLQDKGVVANGAIFVDTARGNAAISAIQPGYYKVRTHIPSADAVKRLADPDNRVGRLVVPEGRRLDDTTDMKSNKTTSGILSLVAKASCVELDGNRHCGVSAADLRSAATDATPSALSVPDWAVKPVTALGKDHRRIEGLIAPGTFNVDPSGSGESDLSSLISAGAAVYAKSGLVDAAKTVGMTPYEILIAASLLQQEANSQDFAKVAQVIYNRLKSDRGMLEFDSTVNYPLERREVATSDADRAAKTPWNTYVTPGLPATPICSPSAEAVNAAAHPEPGDWLYFVTIDSQGTTLFTKDYQEHLANIELAKRNGVLDSSQ